MLIKTEPTSPYLYDGNLLLAETDNAGKIQKVYINDGQGIVGMVRYIYKDDGTFSHYQPLYYMFDSLGSVSLVTGEDGKPLQNYKYSPYGSSTNVENDPVNSLRFVGRYGGYQDDDTNLTNFWHRWYSTEDGRWISRDPIGEMGGVNLMTYVGNRPVMKTDVYGLLIDPGPQSRPGITTPPCPLPPQIPTKTNCDRGPNCAEQNKTCIENAIEDFDGTERICVAVTIGCAIACAITCKGQPWCASKCAAICTLAGGGCDLLNYATLAGNMATCAVRAKNCK